MKLKSIICLICLIISLPLVVATDAHLSEVTTINVVSEKWENCTNEDGSGLYFDLLRAVYGSLGLDVKFQLVPYKRSIFSVKVNKADIAIGAYEREVDQVLYPKWHFFVDDVSVVFLKENAKYWKGEKTLSGENVIWLRGYSYDKYIHQKMEYYEVDDQKNAFKRLEKGRFKYYLGPAILIQPEIDDAIYEMHFLQWIKMYMVFQHTKRGQKLAQIWDVEFERLLKSGRIKSLFGQYGMMDYYQF